MTIEAGKYYRCQNGQQAFIAAVVPPSPYGGVHSERIRGYLKGSDAAFVWRLDGTHPTCDCWNLVDEWIDLPSPLSILRTLVDCVEIQLNSAATNAAIKIAKQVIAAEERKP